MFTPSPLPRRVPQQALGELLPALSGPELVNVFGVAADADLRRTSNSRRFAYFVQSGPEGDAA
ncbi:hypothetical protein DWB77_00049 [Streptomyces hundungensis]|uniref:Uncharacterized protein n=1 Tax=Streptomyces hundungensis TaxID=1077946 RepID=A0A387HB49_9ACTN|nr:hypothetical protein [Streptomyces hundungensis]AYG77942.1 hypothetical protein DWB77_00049 [Streptomyces hundungensis]